MQKSSICLIDPRYSTSTVPHAVTRDVMKCPRCHSQDYSRNGLHQGQQKYLCKSCGRQWLAVQKPRGYPESVRNLCITMYRNGLGARSIERYTGISHNTITNWVRQRQQPSHQDASQELGEGSRRKSDFIMRLVSIWVHP